MNFILIHLCIVKEFLYDETVVLSMLCFRAVLSSCAFDAVLLAVLRLCTFATDTTCQLNVFWHDRDTFCVDCTQVGVFEQTNKECFRSFLQ
jgi:hypothetical protein